MNCYIISRICLAVIRVIAFQRDIIYYFKLEKSTLFLFFYNVIAYSFYFYFLIHLLHLSHRISYTNIMKYYISGLLAMLMFSSSFIATKITYQAFSPVVLCIVRFTCSCILLAIYRICTHQTPHISKQDLKPVILSALLGISIYYVLENTALTYTSASMASLIEASFPIITILIGILIYHERTSKRMLLGILMSIVGVCILTGSMNGGGWIGNIMLLMAGVLWGLYNYITQRIPKHYDALTITFYQMLFGTIGFIPFLCMETPQIQSITPEIILALLYLAGGCSVGALLLYNYALKGLKASHASALMNAMPVFGLILSALILHETILVRHVLGGIIVIIGVFISTFKESA